MNPGVDQHRLSTEIKILGKDLIGCPLTEELKTESALSNWKQLEIIKNFLVDLEKHKKIVKEK